MLQRLKRLLRNLFANALDSTSLGRWSRENEINCDSRVGFPIFRLKQRISDAGSVKLGIKKFNYFRIQFRCTGYISRSDFPKVFKNGLRIKIKIFPLVLEYFQSTI